MRLSTLTAVALASVSSASVLTTPSEFGPDVPSKQTPTLYRENDVHDKRSHPAVKHVILDPDDKLALAKVLQSMKVGMTAKAFADMKLPISGNAVSKLSRAYGVAIVGKMNATPGQPATIVYTFFRGVFECAGKPIGEAIECGRDAVRLLGDNSAITLPKKCNSYLGQLELLGTGWPAPCNDPEIKQHPKGNAASRWVMRKACEAFSHEQTIEERLRGDPTCAEKFPSDGEIAQNEEALAAEAVKLEEDEFTKARLEEAKNNLVALRKEVQDKLNRGNEIDAQDIERAAAYIADGAFLDSATSSGEYEVERSTDLAVWYLGDMKPETNDLDDLSSKPLPSWVTATNVTARYVPFEVEANQKAFDRVDSRADYRNWFQNWSWTISPHDDEMCYSQKGLEQGQFQGFDYISAALTYVQSEQDKDRRGCKACEMVHVPKREDGSSVWSLRCGSIDF